MDAASESNEIEKGLNQWGMIGTHIFRKQQKNLQKVSTERIRLVKILRNKAEITTLISECSCQS